MGEENGLFQRSVVAIASGNVKRAKKLIAQILEDDKNNIEMLSFLTSMYQQNSQPEFALQMAKRTTELDPNNPQHWNNLGYIYLMMEQWQAAEQCYANATILPNAPPTIFLNHARTLAELGRTKAARMQLKQALLKSLPGELERAIKTDPQFVKLRPLLD